MTYLLNGIYFFFLLLISPLLFYRMIRYGKYRDGWAEKFWGHAPDLPRKDFPDDLPSALTDSTFDSTTSTSTLGDSASDLIKSARNFSAENESPRKENILEEAEESKKEKPKHQWVKSEDDAPADRFRRLWFHAVSVGEVNLLKPILREIKARHPRWECVISATSRTGMELARRVFPDETVFYCPLDFSWATRNAMKRIRPDWLVLVELELWPNLIQAAKEQGVRVAIVNGRISDGSFRSYRRVRWLLRALFRKIDVIAVQDEIAAAYFQRLSGLSCHDLRSPGKESDVSNSSVDRRRDQERPICPESGRGEAGVPIDLTRTEERAGEERTGERIGEQAGERRVPESKDRGDAKKGRHSKNSSSLVITGSIKFDGVQTNRHNEKTQRLARLAGIAETDLVFLAGSTQEPEEMMALETFRQLWPREPRLRLILVPRHPERFDAVAKLLEKSEFSWVRRSTFLPPQSACSPEEPRSEVAANAASVVNSDKILQAKETLPSKEILSSSEDAEEKKNVSAPRILLVDTIGELGGWWGTAQVAFVGGSMGKRGGQNMLEPAAYGAAVSFGPNTRNFRDISDMMLRSDAAVVVRDSSEMTAFVRQMISEPARRQELGEHARQLVLCQQGATAKTVLLLESEIE